MESSELLTRLRDDIVRLCSPQEILLFSQKHKPCGEISAVKLCVIITEGDARQIEHRLYVEVESDLPFDVLVYTDKDWQRLLQSQMSFATHISNTGRVIYAAN